jgi:hypothetical protein
MNVQCGAALVVVLYVASTASCMRALFLFRLLWLLLLAWTWTSIDPDPAVKMRPTYRIGIRDSELAGWQGHHGEHAF